MKKLPVYVMTAAIAMAGAASTSTITSQAAVRAYIIGGNGQQCETSWNNNWTGNWSNSYIPDFNQPSVPDMPSEDGADDSFTAQVVALVNEERAKAGLAPLRVDSKALAAASVRAQEIERSFSHTRPDGSSFDSALRQSGVSFIGAGENIAYGQRTPEEVMEGWMNSQGHRANILNKDYTTIGVGYHQNSAGTGYWTQLFTR